MRLLAPAKINLHLRVGPVENSGFHSLLSWMCSVALFDTLTIEQADARQILLSCDDPSLPCDATNLVVRAATAMRREAIDAKDAAARIRLEKRIPLGGGLGGGSSDAACTLLGLSRLWNLNWPVDRLSRIAASLGSDVPFFFARSKQHLHRSGRVRAPHFSAQAAVGGVDTPRFVDPDAGRLSKVR